MYSPSSPPSLFVESSSSPILSRRERCCWTRRGFKNEEGRAVGRSRSLREYRVQKEGVRRCCMDGTTR